MNNEYLLGLMIGIITAVIAYLIIWKLLGGKHIKGNYFDERQASVRGRAYRYGFFTTIIALLPFIYTFEAGISLPLTAGTAMFLAMLIGIDVYAVYSIMNDAYFGIDANKGRYTIFFAVIAAVNAYSGWMNLREYTAEGSMLLDFAHSANALVALAFAPIVIAMIVKTISDKKEDADEES